MYYKNMSHRDKNIRSVAAEMLSSFGAQGELLLVEGVRKDSNPLVRAACLRGIVLIGSRCFRILLAACSDTDINVRKDAGCSLVQMGPRHIHSAMVKLNESERASVRSVCDSALRSRFDDSYDIKYLLLRIRDEM